MALLLSEVYLPGGDLSLPFASAFYFRCFRFSSSARYSLNTGSVVSLLLLKSGLIPARLSEVIAETVGDVQRRGPPQCPSDQGQSPEPKRQKTPPGEKSAKPHAQKLSTPQPQG